MPNTAASRVTWVDVAKAYGIVLVFYGHFVGQIAWLGYDAAVAQLRLVYSFHMPLFFVLAGYVWHPSRLGPGAFIRDRIRRRIVPALLFDLVTLLLAMLRDGALGAAQPTRYLTGLLHLARGHPEFNTAGWFLICLFMVEIVQYGRVRYFREVGHLAALAIVGALAACVMWPGAGIASSPWYVAEALVAYVFFLFGAIARDTGTLNRLLARGRVLLGILAGIAWVCTVGLNSGPFRHAKGIVSLGSSSYGQPLLFVGTALAGSIAVVLLAQLTPAARPVLFAGRHTLALIGLNGLINYFVNAPLARLVMRAIPAAPLPVFVVSLIVALGSIAVCAPILPALGCILLPDGSRQPSPAAPDPAPPRSS